MATLIKNQEQILAKLGIEALNPMQVKAKQAIHTHKQVVLLSPTGTGKTLAFLLPIIGELDPARAEVQALIIVPSRELAIQIEQVIRNIGSGYKANAFYGGRPFAKDRADLVVRPAILVGTPGRISDHLDRETFTTEHINTLVLDEYDKSLEIGFEKEMHQICYLLPLVKKKVLTSATQGIEIPEFVGINDPVVLDYLDTNESQLSIKLIMSPAKDKLQTLVDTLCHLGNQPGIVFCNFKDSIQRVSAFLDRNGISHGVFYGGMDQKDRERALIKFRNGTHQIIVATDLAARGLDIPEIQFIIHYHLPLKAEEFTHRNGRTARMHKTGTAFVIKWVEEHLPDFITAREIEKLAEKDPPKPTGWSTVFVSGGRRDKVSKGDIAGVFFKQGGLAKDELGLIELKQDCAFVAIASTRVDHVIRTLDQTKIKKRKVRVYLI